MSNGTPVDATTLAVLQSVAPSVLPAPPADVTNRFADNVDAAALGQKFFFDPGFSGALLDGDNDGGPTSLGTQGQTGKVACVGCHVPTGGFSDTRTRGGQISLGAAWGKRRAPSLLDVGQAKIITWDGRRDATYNQPFAPIETTFEMNSSRLYVAEQIAARYASEYTALFGALPDFSDTTRFPALTAEQTGCPSETLSAEIGCHGMPGDHAEFDNLASADQDAVTRVVVNFGKAIGAYERKLSCGTSRFDSWVNGNANVLSASEQNGAVLFAGKAGCTQCHSGPFMSDQQFHNLGLTPAAVAVAFIDDDDHGAKVGLAAAIADPLDTHGAFSDGDDGRLPSAVTAAMDGAFRTPTLRCVSQRPSFFHTGQIGTLDQSVSYFVQPHAALIGTNELTAVDLSDSEQSDLVAFLKALDGPGAAAALRTAP